MGFKTLGIVAVIIGLLFFVTLKQARELGTLDGVITSLNKEIDFNTRLNEIKTLHQSELAEKDRSHEIETRELRNTIIDQAVEFESKGLTDPIGLSDDNTKWLNDFMRENSRNDDSSPAGDIPPDDTATTDSPPDRNDGIQP